MDGFSHHKAYLDDEDQKALLEDVLGIIRAAPLYTPTMPKSGRPFSVEETNCGPLGWVSDKAGYRYQQNHPVTGQPWPAFPARFLNLWHDLTGLEALPEAGLINYYKSGARMGLHQDRDEEEYGAPVLSLSLGNSAIFRLGGLKRRGPTRSMTVSSGDVIILQGKARLCYHGIDRIIQESSDLLGDHPAFKEGRFNITMRRVTKLPASL